MCRLLALSQHQDETRRRPLMTQCRHLDLIGERLLLGPERDFPIEVLLALQKLAADLLKKINEEV